MWQAIARSGSEADRLFAEAYKKYERALHIEPDKRALSLGQHATMKHGLEADELFVAAYGKYAHSVQTRPEDYAKP